MSSAASILSSPTSGEPASILFARTGAFLAARTCDATYARAVRDAHARDALWSAHWPQASARRHDDVRIWLAFMLACATLGLDTAQGMRLALQARDPARWMRLFLADHGLLAYDAFDVEPRAPRHRPTLAQRFTSLGTPAGTGLEPGTIVTVSAPR